MKKCLNFNDATNLISLWHCTPGETILNLGDPYNPAIIVLLFKPLFRYNRVLPLKLVGPFIDLHWSTKFSIFIDQSSTYDLDSDRKSVFVQVLTRVMRWLAGGSRSEPLVFSPSGSFACCRPLLSSWAPAKVSSRPSRCVWEVSWSSGCMSCTYRTFCTGNCRAASKRNSKKSSVPRDQHSTGVPKLQKKVHSQGLGLKGTTNSVLIPDTSTEAISGQLFPG